MSLRRVCCGVLSLAALAAVSASAPAFEPPPVAGVIAAPEVVAVPQPPRAPAAGTTAKPVRVALPAEVSLPRLGIWSTVVGLGLQPDGQVEVPPLRTPEQAGWYELGARPGEVGAAVVLGHVNGYRRPGVFLRLSEARAGDEVVVVTEDGAPLRFVVRRVETVDKGSFPTERVYGPTSRPEIRLITCGGAFDAANGRYLSNVIVYGVLAPENGKAP